jgi:Flp pilus assembly protein TadD
MSRRPQKRSAGSGRSHKTDGSWVALAFLAIAVYLPSLGGEFLWDDNSSVTESEIIRDAGGWWKAWIAPPRSHPDYFPLTTTSFWVQWRLFGDHPMGYRLVSVLLHASSVVLLWRLLRELALPGAWLAAAWMAIHPVNVESVAWIAEQKNLLCLVFALPAFQSFVRWHRTGAPGDYRLALACHAAALASKASVVALPLVFTAYLFWRGTRPGKREVLALAPFLACSLAFGLLVIHFQHQRAVGAWEIAMPSWPGRIGGAAMAFWFYLGKALWPFSLATIYPRWPLDPPQAGQILLALATAGGLATLWIAPGGRNWLRGLAFGLTTYALLLAPALGLIKMSFMRHSLVADHFQHLALPALLATAVATGAGAATRWPRLRARPQAANAGLAIVGVILATLSWQRAALHGSHEALWQDALAKNPGSAQPYQMLGTIAALRGDTAAAETQFRRAIALGSPEASTNLGITLCNAGRFEDALPLLRRGAESGISPGQSYTQWARALTELDRTGEALGVLEAGANRYPENILLNSAAGASFVMALQPAKALEFLERCERLASNDPQTKLYLAQALEALGRDREAAEKRAAASHRP